MRTRDQCPRGYDSPPRGTSIPAPRRATCSHREDDFAAPELDRTLWFPHHLPQWSSRAQSAARYRFAGRCAAPHDRRRPAALVPRLRRRHARLLAADRCVSPGRSAAASGSTASPLMPSSARSRPTRTLYTPAVRLLRAPGPLSRRPEQHGRALDDRLSRTNRTGRRRSVSPRSSAATCEPDVAAVGMGVHPFGDPRITDEWAQQTGRRRRNRFHVYAVEWTTAHVAFFVDDAARRPSSVSHRPIRCSSCSASTPSPGDDGLLPPPTPPREFGRRPVLRLPAEAARG